MAGYAVLVSVVELLDDIILHDDCPHFRHMGRVLRIITSLRQKFSSLEKSLRGYASKGDKDAERVEAQIRDAAYIVQHIIESKISKKTKSNYKFLQVLKKAEQKINQIKGELADIQGRQMNEYLQQKYVRSSHVHPSGQILTNTTTTVGFDEYLTTIKDQLCGHSLQREVISIVGTGGIGKTTFARNTFVDALIVEYFDCHAWVTVSQEYNAQEVLQSLMKSLEVKESSNKGERELIFQHLKGRRYLIVLDDMWDTKVWDEVMHIFPKDDNNGSRIVLTTRFLNIAKYARTSSGFIHQIQFLKKDDSWNLLQKHVFAQNGCPPELEDIGKSIVSKCGGLPLAIVVIAGVLSNDKTLDSWKNIETNLNATLSGIDKNFSSVLSFSYNYLPHQLKACFLYMGIFPEDYGTDVSDLNRLWVAEGFLKSANKSKTLEEVGEECLEDLVARNLVIITGRKPNGQVKYCVLHDLLRDLCRKRAVDECFFHLPCDGRNNLNPRRINLNCGHPFEADDNVVHSVHYFRNESNSGFVKTRMDILKRLRVLNGDKIGDHSWIDFSRIFRLKLLKIHWRVTVHQLLPSIFMSHNIHTLIMTSSSCLILPPEVWNMTQLRHLIIKIGMRMPPIPMIDDDIPIQKLECLQTLMTLCDFRFTKEVITMIPNVRLLTTEYGGEREVSDRIWESYGLDNLVDLHRLEELTINSPLRQVNFPTSFALPPNLKKLSLFDCELPCELMTVVGSLLNLQVLRLLRDALVGEVWESTEGEFQSLKYLKLECLDLQRWIAEASHFPRLECLKIKMCTNLEEIPIEIGDIETLKYIRVDGGTKSAGDSAIGIQEAQREMGNCALQVEVIDCFY